MSGSMLPAGPGSKWPPAVVNAGRFALADGVQVHAVRTGFEAGDGDGDFDGLHAGHEFHVVGAGRLRVDFAQLDRAVDAVAGERRFRAHACWADTPSAPAATSAADRARAKRRDRRVMGNGPFG